MLNRLLISFFVVTTAISSPVFAGNSAGLALQDATSEHLVPGDTSIPNDDSKTVPIVQPKALSNSDTAIPTLPINHSEKDPKSPKLQSLAFTLSCIGLFGFMVVRRFKRAFI